MFYTQERLKEIRQNRRNTANFVAYNKQESFKKSEKKRFLFAKIK